VPKLSRENPLAGLREPYVEVLSPRGMPVPGSRDPRSCTNRFMAYALPVVWIADPAKHSRGVDLIVSDVQRIAAASVDQHAIHLAGTTCKQRNYTTRKNKKNDPNRIELLKYCPRERRHTLHREAK